MTQADRLYRWNRWYDGIPEAWRFQVVIWGLIVIGALNMLMTIAVGFPFGLLLLLAIAAITAIRLPHAFGWLQAGESEAAGSGARMEITAPDWVVRVNRWYDDLPEHSRPFVLLAALAIPGAINMMLTIAGGFPFGLLFLLAVLLLLAIRAPYAAGWIKMAEGTAPAPLFVSPPRSEIEGGTPPLASLDPPPASAAAVHQAPAPEGGAQADRPDRGTP
ncbi:hypothetical protein [Roseicella frigidaeris]|uniref:Uncharacterized protein n=1 Tax=Roseicella frigidaeris TaxID=2230885 RepID=A0A327M5B1_9PROT|nr:hypothetical protein [Roseicella frigidaeris]RAI57697.1 hypothetical protein DOO78_18080 [Roseicella frigidaeris]